MDCELAERRRVLCGRRKEAEDLVLRKNHSRLRRGGTVASSLRRKRKGPHPERGRALCSFSYVAVYFAVITKYPTRFCAQQASLSSLQNGCSSPLLTVATRSPARPRLRR
jgi:hypothetical protein